MQKLLILGVLFGIGVGCQPGNREVVVTRDQFGEAWPLEVNSAKIVCDDDSEAAYLRLGRRLYGLNAAAVANGAAAASEVVRQIPVDPKRPQVGSSPADPAPLAEACDPAPGNVAAH